MPTLSRGLLRERANIISLLTRVLDALAVVMAGEVAYYIRMGEWAAPQRYQITLLMAGLITLVAFPAAGIYHSWRGQRVFSQVRQIGIAWIAVAVLLGTLGTLTKTSAYFSRQWMAIWFVVGAVFLFLFRAGLTLFLRRLRERGWNHRKILIVGTGRLASDVARRIDEATWTGLKIVAFFTEDTQYVADRFRNVPLFPLSKISCYLEAHQIDEVWFALPSGSEQRIHDILHDLRHSTVAIRYVPDILGFRLLNPAITEIAGMAILDLNITPMRGVNRAIKAVEDKVLATLILVLVSPLMIAIAIGIKLSSDGPIIFKQRRHGWNGKPIKIYKFRTMVVHQEEAGVITQATRNDPRVTRFGAMLRRASLDELPQFFNVLQGRMSIVGPRPHAIAHNEEYKDIIDEYMQRHKVKPGITGWAQINGWRGETDDIKKMKKRIEFDLYYIQNWSLWFDLKIIALTLFRGFIHQNAY